MVPDPTFRSDAERHLELAPCVYRSWRHAPDKGGPLRVHWWRDVCFALLTVQEGTCTVHHPGREPVHIRAGESALADAGHHFVLTRRSRIVMLGCDFVRGPYRRYDQDGAGHPIWKPGRQQRQPSWEAIFGRPHPVRIGERDLPGTAALVIRLAEVDQRDRRNHLMANLRLGEWLCRAARVWGGAPDEATDLPGRVDAYLRYRLRDGVHLQDVADAVGYSVGHLCGLYKRARGITLGEAIARERLCQATGLLASARKPPYSVGDVAHRVGFADAGAFSTWFRKRTGTTPREWRLAHRG